MEDLFRKEATPSVAGEWLGKSGIPVPKGQRLLATCLSVAGVGILLISLFGRYQAHARYRGEVAYSYPPQVVFAPTDGVVSGAAVDVNTPVEPNQALLSIEHADPTSPEASERIVLTSPMRGNVVALAVHPGEYVTRGQRLASIVGSGTKMVARFPLAGRDLRYVKQNSIVRLSYPGDANEPDLPHVGRVAHVDSAIGAKDFAYEVTVAIDGIDTSESFAKLPLSLRPGSQVAVELSLGQRSIVTWVFPASQ